MSMEVTLVICGCPTGSEPCWGLENKEFKLGGVTLGAKLLRAVSTGFITVLYEAILETSSANTRIAIDT